MTVETWAYMPQKTINEGLEWLTDVQRCRASEKRRSTRIRPRQDLQYKYLMTPSQFGQAKLLAKTIGGDSLFVPLWTMYTATAAISAGSTAVLKDTSYPLSLYEVGSSVMLYESPTKWETHTVELNSTNPAYPYITLEESTTQSFTHPLLVPLRVGKFAQEFEASRSSLQGVETSARFIVYAGDTYFDEWTSRGGLYSSETYAQAPVVTDRSLSSSGVREQFERRCEEIDSTMGDVYRFPVFTTPDQDGKITWSSMTRAGMLSLLYWIHSRKGQWKSFWVPNWNADFHITREVQATDTTLEIDDIGLRNMSITLPMSIMIRTTAGARIYCRIYSAASGSSGKEILTLGSQVGTHLYTFDIAETCALTLSRFASDRVELTYDSSGNVTATATIVQVPG